MFNKLVLASNNPGKLREFAALFAPFEIEVLPQSAFAIPEAEEPHHTFIENALAKARHAAQLSGLPALADDSGLCVAALGGEPGVHSAYYGGREGSRAERDARNNARLLAALDGRAERRAHYCCVLVLVRHAQDPQPIIAEGEWHGEILAAPRGEGGFGYDPLFLVPAAGCSAAELPAERKNVLSHRAQAFRRLAERLRAPR
ncbi:MAG: RdgB/HAM1 family non-canonical purine NTP pyrophosphatase [Rhodocyclaceae bacterium]|nr:RdgB/HAM1 family non-canonical purine NTP pyrophosphatase [Rhodocyclaceae bacterium]